MKNSVSLLKKDFLVHKFLMGLIFVFLVITNLSASFMAQFDANMVSFLEITVVNVSSFFVLYRFEEDKCKGSDLLITTTLTRLDVIISRYLLCGIIFLTQIVVYLVGQFFVSGNVADSRGMIEFNLFTSFMYLFLFIPCTFAKKIKWMIAYMIIFLLINYLYLDVVYDYFLALYNINSILVNCFAALFLIFMFVFSMFLSKKIFFELDL